MVSILAKCDDIASPSDGNVSMVTNGTHTTAIYTCGVGFTLEGVVEPACQEDGSWSTSPPTCGTWHLKLIDPPLYNCYP